MDENDINRAAKQLIDQYGNMAEQQASKRAVELGGAGDIEGARAGAAILQAVRRLQKKKPSGSERTRKRRSRMG